MRHRGLDRRALTLFPLVLTMFCLVSGGPFGLEAAVGQSGAGMAILLIVAVPIFWAAPVAMMTAEFTAAIPVEGGYYAWTKRAFGNFWGFQCGWWTWLYSIADATLYPILFCDYLSDLLRLSTGTDPFVGRPLARAVIALAVIVVFTGLNVRGTRLVGRASILFGAVLTIPFLLMIAIGAWRAVVTPGSFGHEFIPAGSGLGAVFATGLYGVMWNYLGWDNLSTVAEEVDEPHRAFPRALLYTVPLVMLLYLLSVVFGLRFVPDLASWKEHNWPAIAASVGGPWLGIVTGFAALTSTAALFMTALLASSRIPFAMSEDRLLPKSLLAVHPQFKTPWFAVLLSGGFYVVLAVVSDSRSCSRSTSPSTVRR